MKFKLCVMTATVYNFMIYDEVIHIIFASHKYNFMINYTTRIL